MKIIGISGKAESGKTTLASMLKEQLEADNKKVLLINYGDFVKFIAKEYYNWNGDKDETGRALLQRIGTEQGRNTVDKNIWVDMVINTVAVTSNDYDVAIVADCRFPNEFDRWAQKDKEILKVKITRPEHENKLTDEQKQHSSETALDYYKDWDVLVLNDGSLEDLTKQAENIIQLALNK